MASQIQKQDTSVASDLAAVPNHVAIIMDGNGRWAQKRGLPRAAGHKAGVDALHDVVRAAKDFQIKALTVYAFSTENWQRPEWEVSALLKLMEYCIDNDVDKLHAEGVKIRHVGRKAGLSLVLVAKIRRSEELTCNNTCLTLNIAFNYGGRAEIVDAVRQMISDKLTPEQVDEQMLTSYLSASYSGDPDLVIRTAGEMRLSNFLVWQAAYAEFYSTPTLWPDFGREDLHQALLAFQQRKRRFGRVDPEPR
jgi:undecaprenyl diphosphate synthase